MWSLIINVAMIIAMMLSFKPSLPICSKIFGITEYEFRLIFFKHLANDELLIGVFNMVPLLALLIIRMN